MSDADELPGFPPEQVEALRRAAKEELRRQQAALRRTLSAPARAARSRALCERLIEHEIFVRAKVVAAYSALRFEADPSVLVGQAWTLGKTVALPRVLANTGDMLLSRYLPGDPLVESGFMVKEPLESAESVALESVELVLVPGLAFDLCGNRLGFGQGYYDRFLPRMPNAVRIGLLFELQLLAEVPAASHDIPVDYVATERRVLRCNP